MNFFNVHNAHYELVKAISELQPMRMGLRATSDELENNAGYIEQLCKLVANHVQSVMAEASASTTAYKIADDDAMMIRDIGIDLAAQLNEAAYRTEEEEAA